MSNIEKIQSMISGNFEKKIQVGYEPKTIEQRKEGEKWTDANGREWVKENSQRKQITKVPAMGFKKCNDCKKLILKQRDQATYNRMQRCFHCQINFEVDLKAAGKWKEWVIDQETQRWESIEKEIELIMKETEEQTKKQFERDIVHAVSNEGQKQNRIKIDKETRQNF